MSNRAKPGVYVAWKTVTYRSVVLMMLGAVAIFFVLLHVIFPQFTDSTVRAAGRLSSGLLEKVAGLAPPLKTPSAQVSQQAHFTALDGTVRVRKSNGAAGLMPTTAFRWKRATSFRPALKAWRRLFSTTAPTTRSSRIR